MRNTALSHIHESLGAKMVPFAGYNMPVQYEGVNAEHEVVRTAVGVFDVSHMGEFIIEGPNALALIQKAFIAGIVIPVLIYTLFNRKFLWSLLFLVVIPVLM